SRRAATARPVAAAARRPGGPGPPTPSPYNGPAWPPAVPPPGHRPPPPAPAPFFPTDTARGRGSRPGTGVGRHWHAVPPPGSSDCTVHAPRADSGRLPRVVRGG